MTRSLHPPLASTWRNAFFANRARGFVKCASKLPGFPLLVAGGAIAVILMTTVGAFGTGAMPLGWRAAFWLALIGWNVAKWQAWFAWRIHQAADWMAASLLGAIVLNLPLPLEIAALLRIFGHAKKPLPPVHVWIEALAISGAILALIVLVRRSNERLASSVEARRLIIELGGVLARAGLRDVHELSGFKAEDHFCRLYLTDGRATLIHGRFSDLFREVDAWAGMRIHRGSWVRLSAVRGAVRSNRRWLLQIDGGAALPVSGRCLAAVRQAGLLRTAGNSSTPAARFRA